MEQYSGIKSFLKKAVEKEGKPYDDNKATELIKSYNHDYDALVSDIGKRAGFTDEELPAFKQRAYKEFGFTPVDDENKAEIEYLNMPVFETELPGFEKYKRIEEHRSLGEGLLQNLNTSLQKVSKAPKVPGQEFMTAQDNTAVNVPLSVTPEITPEYDFEADIKRANIQSRIADVSKKVSDLTSQLDQQAKLNKQETGFISEQHKKVREEFDRYDSQLDSAIKEAHKSQGDIFTNQSGSILRPEDRRRIADLSDIKTLYAKIGKVLEAPQGSNTKNQLNGLLYGLTKSNTANDFFTLGVNEMLRNVNVKDAFDKAQKGEELKPEELALIDTYKTLLQYQNASQQNFGTTIGSGLQEMIPFIAQFALTSGAGNAAKQVVKKFIESRTKNAILGKVIGSVAKVGTQSVLMPYTYQEYARRTAPVLNEQGELTPGEGKFEAAWKSFATTAAEVFGEDMTDISQKALRNHFVKKMSENPAGAQRLINKLGVIATAETGIPSVQSIPFELFGEEITGTLEAVIDQDGSFFTPESQKQLLALVTMAGGVASSVSPVMRYKAKNAWNKAKEQLNDIPDGNFTKAVDDATMNIEDPEELIDTLDDLATEYNVSPEDYGKARNYVAKSIRYSQMSISRQMQIRQNIADYADKDGNLTSTVIDGQTWYIRNTEDLGQEGKAIFAKDQLGNIKPFSSAKITSWETKSGKEVESAILQEDELLDQQAEANDKMQAFAEENNLEPGAPINTIYGSGQVVSLNPDGTITAQDEKGQQVIVKPNEIIPAPKSPYPEAIVYNNKNYQVNGEQIPGEITLVPLNEQGEIADENVVQLPIDEFTNLIQPAETVTSEISPLVQGEMSEGQSVEPAASRQPPVADIDNLSPEEAYIELSKTDPETAKQILADEIQSLKDKAKELRSQKSEKRSEKLAFISQAKQLESEAALLEQLLTQPSEISPLKQGEMSTGQRGEVNQPVAKTIKPRKPAQLSKVRTEAIQIQPSTVREVVLQHFIQGGKINIQALQYIFGGTKGREQKSIEGERKARISYYSPTGQSIDEMAHYLWENNVDKTPNANDVDYRDELVDIIQTYNSPTAMANDLVSVYKGISNEDYTAEQEQALAEEAYENRLDENLDKIADELENNGLINSENDLENVILQYNENTGNRQGKTEGETAESTQQDQPDNGGNRTGSLGETTEQSQEDDSWSQLDHVPFRTNGLNISEKATADFKTRTNAQNALTALQKIFNIPVQIIHSSEIPGNVGNRAKRLRVVPVAFYNNGTAYIISDMITSVSDMKKSYLHEAVLHQGLDILFNNGPVTILGKKFNSKNELLGEVFSRLPEDIIGSRLKEYGKELFPQLFSEQKGKIKLIPGANLSSIPENLQLEIAEEALATLNEMDKIPSRLEVFIDSLWKFLKKLVGFSGKQFTRTELHQMLTDHRNLVKQATNAVDNLSPLQRGTSVAEVVNSNIENNDIRFQTREELQKQLESKYPGLKLFIGGRNNILKLSEIQLSKEQQGKGIGSKVMHEITNHADKKRLTISLTPSIDYGATSVNRLKNFYKRFGFVENKGRNKDFTISDSMYRLPADGIRFRTEEQSKIIQDAKKYADINDFIEAYENANFRDSHRAPGYPGEYESMEQRMDEGTDFNLMEVSQGFSLQPDDYFDPRNGARWYGYDDVEGMQSYRAIRTVINNIQEQIDKYGEVKKVPKIKVYRAVPKDLIENKLIDGDWITFSKDYAIGHGEHRFGESEYKIITQVVPVNQVWWDGNDINEWGYDTGQTEFLGRSDLKRIWEEANTPTIRFRILGERGAANLDKAEEATTRLDNLKVAREMEGGKSIDNARVKFFNDIPDELKNDARIINRGEDTDGEAMKRIQANPQAKAAWADYIRAQEHASEWEKLSPKEQALRIKLATGWERGADGKWRYEVPDGKLLNKNSWAREKLKEFDWKYSNFNQMFAAHPEIKKEYDEFPDVLDGKVHKLNDVFSSTELFSAYPELTDVKVAYRQTVDKGASYNPKTKTIELNDVLETESTILHEIQHAIQDIEGFAKGGNENIGKKIGTDNLKEAEYKLNQYVYKNDDKTEEQLQNDKEYQALLEDVKIAKLEAENGGINYKRLAGEVESRNVQTRMNFTPEQRRQTLLSETEDVSREDQIFLNNAFESDIRFRTAETFYSPTEKALNQISQNKGTVEQFKAMLLKNGAKQAEMDWMGWDEHFLDIRKMITKAEVQQWIEENKIEVEEVVKSRITTGDVEMNDFTQEASEKYDELRNIARKWEAWEQDEAYTGEISEWKSKQIKEWEEEYVSYDNILERLLPEMQENPDNYIIEDVVEDDTKYSQYQLPGGENYKEVLLTMPVEKKKLTLEEFAAKMNLSVEDARKAFNVHESVGGYIDHPKGSFHSSHFDEPNILAHIRFNERTDSEGNKVLFIEEIQSDWAQKGKKEGFKPDVVKLKNELSKKQKELKQAEEDLNIPEIEQNIKQFNRNMLNKYGIGWGADGVNKLSKEENLTLDKFKTDLRNARHSEKISNIEGQIVDLNIKIENAFGTPDMPFKQTPQWVNLALRRMIRYAAENNFDRIAWTPGSVQAERYDLSKQVDEVELVTFPNGKKSLYAYKGEQNVLKQFIENDSQLSDYVGKDVAEKILNQEPEIINGGEVRSLKGQELSIGGTGMKAFYDAIVPNAAKELGKKFGAKVEETEINAGNDINNDTGEYLPDNKVKVLSLPVTPAMQESALNEGMPLFRVKDKIEQQRSEVNTQPTEAQKEAGNYKKGHVRFDGFDISIENPKGSVRSGKRLATPEEIKAMQNGSSPLAEGSTATPGGVNEPVYIQWQQQLPADYGYFRGTVGKDKDHIDVFIGENPESDKIYVVDQIDPQTGKFDEHKILLGFNDISTARKTYLAAFEKGWKGLGAITRTNKEGLKQWFTGNTKVPFAQSEINAPEANPGTVNLINTLSGLEKSNAKFSAKNELTSASLNLKDEAKAPSWKSGDNATESKNVSSIQFDAIHNVKSDDKTKENNLDYDIRGGIFNSPEYKLAQKVQSILKERGIDKGFSVSETDFGNSIYFTVYGDNINNPKLKIRISDHSVSNTDRIFNEQHESSKSDSERIANDIELAMYPERYDKIQTGVMYYSKWNNQRVTEPVKDGKAWVKSRDHQATEKMLDGLNPETARVVSKTFLRESKSGNKIYDAVIERLTEVEGKPVFKYVRKQSNPVTITINGKERPTRNSKGQFIYSTIEGIKNFWEWFGESKVVDEQGRPLVVYHGTNKDFTEFSIGGRYFGFFTDSKEVAIDYGNKVGEYYLNIQDDEYLDINGGWWKDDYGNVERMQGRLERGLIDGFVIKNTKDPLVYDEMSDFPISNIYAVKEPTQIKSATGNNGDFNPEDPDIRFRAKPEEDENFLDNILPKAAKAYEEKQKVADFKKTVQNIREFWQDINLPIRKLEEEIIKRGGKLYNKAKPYRDINLSFGRMEELYRQFTESKMTPILEAIRDIIKEGKDPAFVLPYIIAKHAVERNRFMRMQELDQWIEANPESTANDREQKLNNLALKDYSGVKDFDKEGKYKDPDQLAEEIIEEFEIGLEPETINNLWEKIGAATGQILDHWLKGGQISSKQYQTLKKQYKYFVPLRGWRQGAAKELRYNKGEGFGASLKHAQGRRTLADNPLAYIQAVAFKAIGERVQNEISNSLLNLVMTNYDREKFSDLYAVKKVYYIKSFQYNPDNGTNEEVWEPTLVKPDNAMFESGNAKSEYYKEHMKLRTTHESIQHEVIIHREDGDVAIVFPGNNLSIAQAFNRQNTLYEVFGKVYDAQDLNRIAKVIGLPIPFSNGMTLTNFMKGMFTSLNPVFPFTNFFRDVPEAAITMFIQDNNPALAKHIPGAMKTVYRKLAGKTGTELDEKLQEFYETGAATGYTHEKSPEQIEKDLNKELSRILRSNGLRGKSINTITGIYDIIGKWNQLFEDTTRFAVYLNSLEAGKSREDAAMDAKEASVNFNRKGKGTKLFDSVWAFFNPAIQGMQKNFKLAKDHPKRFWAVAGSVVMLGFLEALLNDIAGGDDDRYFDINDYSRQNYAIIGFGEKFVRIPLPQFWRGFHSLGVISYDMMKGETKVSDGIANILLNFMGGLSPIDIPGFWTDGEFSFAPIIPTWAKPLVEANITNRNFMGETIWKEPFTKALEKQLANSSLHKRNVNPAIKAVTDFVAKDIGGRYGDLKVDIRDGKIKTLNYWLDWNPSKIEHIITSYTGGTGKALSDITTTLTQLAVIDEEIDINNVPFINAFIRNTPDEKWEIVNDWYEIKDIAFDYNAVSDYARKINDKSKSDALDKSKYKQISSIVTRYDKKISKIIEENGLYSDKGESEVTKLMEQAINEIDPLLEN